jgi:hypothetical protein
MAESRFEGMIPRAAAGDGDGDAAAYRDGYGRMMREAAWARSRGWKPTERQIVLALMRTMKMYAVVRGGKSVGGQRPEWLHGRADALRELLREARDVAPEEF